MWRCTAMRASPNPECVPGEWRRVRIQLPNGDGRVLRAGDLTSAEAGAVLAGVRFLDSWPRSLAWALGRHEVCRTAVPKAGGER